VAVDRKIIRKLDEWTAAGLVDADMKDRIHQYELQHASTRGFLFAITWLAVACIVLGVIALVASNWDVIAPAVKLGLYFMLFAGAGCTLLFGVRDRSILQELLRLGLMGYILAGIGLVAQIYHLHSSPWRGMVFWGATTLLLAVSSTTVWGAFLWVPLALSGWVGYLESLHLANSTFTAAITASLGVLGIFGSFPFTSFPHLTPFRKTTFAFACAALLIFSIAVPYARKEVMENSMFAAFMAVLVIWGLVLQLNRAYYPKGTRVGLWIFFGCAAIEACFIRFGQLGAWSNYNAKLLFTALFVGGTLSLGIAAFHFGQRRVFELLCLFIFLRLLVLYGELLLSLTMTGFGLISIGVFIFVGLWGWKKLKPGIYAKLEGQRNAH